MTNPGVLKVNVIDPAVINVDWTVDGTTKANGGDDVRHVDPGAPAATRSRAKAYDNADDDLVRYRSRPARARSPAVYCHRTAWKNSDPDGQLDRDQELKTKG